jgi:23S rRNA pseudouridine1911/1915/1917 synthase
VSTNLQIINNEGALRADKFLSLQFPAISRTKLQKLFDNQQVTVDDEPIDKSYTLKTGDTIEFPHPETLIKPLKATKVPFDILFEDKNFFAINKVPNIAVHPVSVDDEQTTIANGVLYYLGEKVRDIGPLDRPCIVHRLDKETSGVLLIAKTQKAFDSLKAIFANRQIEKDYLAIVRGTPDLLAGSVIVPIGRSPKNPLKMMVRDDGREARTDWDLISVDKKNKIALVKCQLHTGRTHQARVHLQYLGHPVLGDGSYGYRGTYKSRILLHAHRVSLPHPITGKTIEIVAPIPKDMKAFKELFQNQSF